MISRNIIEQILPHKPPFLMVDRISEYNYGRIPGLTAECRINNSLPAYLCEKGKSYLPSVYIIEGLGQSCNLLSVFLALETTFKEENTHIKEKLNHINSIYSAKANSKVESGVLKTLSMIGLLASVEVEFLERVFIGDILTYQIEQQKVIGNLSHFRVNALVKNQTVAKGIIIGSEIKKM